MPNKKPKRLILLIPRDLLEQIDDFRFANRINSRAEAIRALIEKGLAQTIPTK